jgi:hypothetical protein
MEIPVIPKQLPSRKEVVKLISQKTDSAFPILAQVLILNRKSLGGTEVIVIPLDEQIPETQTHTDVTQSAERVLAIQESKPHVRLAVDQFCQLVLELVRAIGHYEKFSIGVGLIEKAPIASLQSV